MNRFSLPVLLLGLFLVLNVHAQSVVVNGVPLSSQTVQLLESQFQTQIVPQAYWYDPQSGLWGLQGGPSMGQLPPNLQLGGPLRSDASGGKTGVFVNGRQLHAAETQALVARYGYVAQGRYWLNAQGVGGLENGPPLFDLRQGQPSSRGYNRSTLGGGLMSDGGCAGYLHPDGPTVMTGNC